MKAIIYFDGACLPHNPNGVGTYGFVIKDATNGSILFSGKGVAFERGTSQMAEYHALIQSLEKALELNIGEVEIYGDSMLVVNQINDIYDVIEPNLLKLYQKSRELLSNFKSWKVKWFRREKNKEADRLSIEAFVEYIEIRNKEKIDNLIPFEIVREGKQMFRLKDYMVILNPPSCSCNYFKKFNNYPLIKKAGIIIKCEHILYIEEKLYLEEMQKSIFERRNLKEETIVG